MVGVRLSLCPATPLGLSLSPSSSRQRTPCLYSRRILSLCSPSPPLNKALSDIKSSGVIACLRAPSAEVGLEAARAAIRGGISVNACLTFTTQMTALNFWLLEVLMSTPDVFEVIYQLVQENPSRTIGVGTILSVEDAKHAIKAGASFLMSPAMIKDLLKDVQGSNALYIPGVMTPTEILHAYSAGARIVKVYPVSALGGVQYISALKKSFHHIPMVASQGITADLVGEYISRGSSAVVLSDAIFDKEAMRQGDFSAICQLASQAAAMGIQAVKLSRSAEVWTNLS